MLEYHKINSVFKRDPEAKHKDFILGAFAQPEFEYLAEMQWTGTEKIDGTNIRVDWDGEKVRFGGRSDNAQIPAVLFEYLSEHFTADRMSSGLRGPLTLYGEGYGGKIQKGSGYQVEQRFILFDALAPHDPLGVWLPQDDVAEIAGTLSIPAVPRIFEGNLADAIAMCCATFKSTIAADISKEAEGLVLRPSTELRDRMGRRIITKVKCSDFNR
jgi:hypothetical protein